VPWEYETSTPGVVAPAAHVRASMPTPPPPPVSEPESALPGTPTSGGSEPSPTMHALKQTRRTASVFMPPPLSKRCALAAMRAGLRVLCERVHVRRNGRDVARTRRPLVRAAVWECQCN
jgi:hypothetical protein